jgi:hypothetical protein
MKRHLIPPVIKRLVWVRDCGCCVVCGGALDPSWWECHHRRFRSRGGKDDLHNLIAVHPKCHLERIHGDITTAEANGWAVSRYGDGPESIPVLYADGSRVLLTSERAA